jgi:transcriptional regulator with XRE-family HTH domain
VAENIVVDGVPISASTLQRLEDTDKSYNAGYKEISELAKFYGVSADYLMDMTDNRKYKLVGINELSLSDEAVEVLNGKKLNNRLISELLGHEDFPKLLSAMEVYIDRKILPQMNQMNAIYKFAEQTIKENFEVSENDEVMSVLQEAVIDEDEYLRYRISERFNIIMRSLFDSHKKDAPPDGQTEVMKEMKEAAKTYISHKDNPKYGKLVILGKQIGLNITKLSEEEINVLDKALQKSEVFRRGKKKK